jgi:hypothetical protein
MGKLTSCLLYLFCISALSSLEIKVDIFNETQRRFQKVSLISLIELQGAMQTFATQKDKAKATFKYEKTLNSPLLVQATYMGVNYNKIIPPINQDNVSVTISVYEKVNNLPTEIELSVLHQFKALKGNILKVVKFYYFNNPTLYTFADIDGGISLHAPSTATKFSAAVSIGEGKSDLQWLRLNPESKQSELVSLAYPLKPGDRVYQLEYEVPLNNEKASIKIKQEYPRSSPDRYLLQPESLQLSLDHDDKFNPQKIFEESLNKNIFKFPALSEFTISFIANELLQDNSDARTDEVTVIIESPYSNAEKIAYPFLSLILIFTMHFYLKSNPAWIKKSKIKEKARLQAELSLLESENKENTGFEKEIAKIQQKIRQLDNQ